MKTSKKQAIMQSLESMGPNETEELLRFIRGLLYNPANDLHYMQRKKRGITEIRRALEDMAAY